ncbi:putative motility protein [Acetobacterium fimetarium]|uniref:Motility protein n=1 Tax=Acetobacterium fimetarium TaxID=52691 RepID=A0ABR6WSU0_9FIRM|nr:YjfB family protein [Acetobacterium fimetarium]MBC3803296.1 putative motility protein [Acetobacterium fimetarium]
MDIAAASMSLSQMQVSQQASMSVMKMAMETGEVQMDSVVEMAATSSAPVSPNPYVGQNLDLTV